MNNKDIINRSDNRSKTRAVKQPITARLYKIDGNTIYYTVTSSTGNKQYLVKILLLSLSNDKLKSLQAALNSDIKVSCSCPGCTFMGYKYILYKNNSGIEKETRSPDITNPNKEGLACKHILVVLDQLKSDYNQIYNLFKEVLSDENTPKSLKDNSLSDEPTEQDLQIIEDFKSACDNLYNQYSDYKNSEDISEPFIKSKFYNGSDPSKILLNLSKPVLKSLSMKFIGKCKSLNDIINLIESKGNSFNILLDSDIKALTRKLNSTISQKTESLINNIILNLIGD